jgi:hypothetical protein
VFSFDLSGKGGTTSSYATAGIALRIIAPRNLLYPGKMPSSRWRYLKEVTSNFMVEKEGMINFYESTWRHNQDDTCLYRHCYENLKYHS